MNSRPKTDPAEKWLAQQILTPAEYEVFLHYPTATRDQLKQKLFDDIRNIIIKTNQDSPPFSPEKLFPYRKINRVFLDKKLTYRESLLIPIKEGFIIKLNPDNTNVRIRFNYAHEIGHTYFFDLSMRPPQKVYLVSSSRYWVEEGYAFDIAREILAPEPFFKSRVSQLSKTPSLRALIHLRNEFVASFDVIIKRLLHDAHSWNKNIWDGCLWEAIILIINRISPHKSNDLDIKVFRSPRYRNKLTSIKRNNRINSLIDDVFHNKGIIDTSIKIGKKEYNVQASNIYKVNGIAIFIIYRD